MAASGAAALTVITGVPSLALLRLDLSGALVQHRHELFCNYVVGVVNSTCFFSIFRRTSLPRSFTPILRVGWPRGLRLPILSAQNFESQLQDIMVWSGASFRAPPGFRPLHTFHSPISVTI